MAQEQQDEVEDGFLVEPQKKVELGLRGTQVMSGDWRKLYQVRGVCGGSLENHRVTRLSHKAEAEDRAWLSGQNFEATQSAVIGHPSDGATKTNFQSALGGRVS
jgi:hypothetical protein